MKKEEVTVREIVSPREIIEAALNVAPHMNSHEGSVWPALIGPTGVGKTAMVRSIAEDRGLAFEHVLLQSELDHEVLGYPRADTRSGTIRFYLADRWKRAAEKPTLVLLDELDKPDRDLLSTVLSLLNDRTVKGIRLHEKTVFVCAMQPVDCYRWQNDETFRALIARLCFIPVTDSGGWKYIESRFGVDTKDIFGVHSAPEVPRLPHVSPRQVTWYLRALEARNCIAKKELDHIDLALAEGVNISAESAKELHKRLQGSQSRVSLSVVAKDPARLKVVVENLPLSDLIAPDVLRATVVEAKDPEPFYTLFRRVLKDGDMDLVRTMIQTWGEIWHSCAEQNGDEIDIFGDLSGDDFADTLVHICEDVLKEKDKK